MNCRHCAAALELPFLDLGSAPPSNAYLTAETLRAAETWYPLRVLVCTSCWLVQTEDHAGREQLFSADYAYFSSVSTSWLRHARDYVLAMQARFALDPSSTVVEVAANDGYLLQYVRAAGIPCYGIEPTASTAAAARARGIEVLECFFGSEVAQGLAAQARSADLIVANNVLAHVPDINDFLAGFRVLLKPDGVATFEFPHLLRLVEDRQFDTVYHEHYSYLSLTALTAILESNGLRAFDVEELPTHGGSLRVFVQRLDAGRRAHTVAPAEILAREAAIGIRQPGFYAAFQSAATRVKNDLLRFLLDAAGRGLRVAGYGAAAKGNTLLNFAGVRADLLGYIADLSPAKQGRYAPGSRIPIVHPDHLLRDRPDFVLILPWNLRAEIQEQLRGKVDWPLQYVTAIPELRFHPGPGGASAA